MTTPEKHIVRATWVGIVANIGLTALKAVAGIVAGSQGLIADAAHSASDIASSVVILFGVRVAGAPPDEDHPYGHGKAEHIAAIILSMLLILIGLQIAYSSATIFFSEGPKPPGSLALIILVVSIISKEALYQYKARLGKRYHSTALLADAWHHRSDAYSSIAALIGVGLAVIGGRFSLPYLLYGDAVAGLSVSVLVIRVGYQLAKESSSVMMEAVLADEETEPMRQTALAVDGVLQIDALLARTHGRYVIVDIKIGVDPHISVEEGHTIAKNVKASLLDRHEEVGDVLVHVNPCG